MTSSSTEPEGGRTVGRHMARGAAWMVLMRLTIRVAGLLNMMIMARLLVPEDFGLVAMAMIVVGAIETLSEFNFDVVLIKNQEARRAHYDTAWTLSIIRGVSMAALLLLLAEPMAALFDEPRLQAIVLVLALSSLLLGIQNIGIVDFRKSFDFRKDFIFMAGDKAAAVAVTICLAFLWRDYWALVGGILGGKLWRVGASYGMHPYRPRLSLACWWELFAFTKWLLAHNILLFFRNRADRLVVGKVLGAATLGLYTIAHDLANLVTTELMAPVRRALLPGYARLASEPKQMRAVFIDVFGLTFWIGAPVAIGIGLLADPLIGLLFGDRWQAAVPITQMLVIAGFVALLSSGSHPVYLALGRPELQAFLGVLGAVLLLPALIVGVDTAGVIGAAIAMAAVQTVVALVDIGIVLSFLKLDVKEIAAVSWRSLAALGLMAASVQGAIRAWPLSDSLPDDALLLLSATTLGGFVYIASSFALWRLFGSGRGPERYVWRALIGALSILRTRIA